MTEFNRYFVAIIPPPPIFDETLGLKKYFHEQYQSKAALNSPPHITLHMPFSWKSEKENSLIATFEKVSSTLTSAPVVLKNYNCFKPRVIFIDVVPSQELVALQKAVIRFCRVELNLFNADYKDTPFHPHLTVAFRDLRKPMFAKAWEEFQSKEFHGEFVAKQISPLKHDGKKWDVFKDFALYGN